VRPNVNLNFVLYGLSIDTIRLMRASLRNRRIGSSMFQMAYALGTCTVGYLTPFWKWIFQNSCARTHGRTHAHEHACMHEHTDIRSHAHIRMRILLHICT